MSYPSNKREKDSVTNGESQLENGTHDEAAEAETVNIEATDSENSTEKPREIEIIDPSEIFCTVMRLWESRTPENGRWLTKPPVIKTDEIPIEESPQYAITLLHRDVDESSEQILQTIIMRGQELRDFLEETIPNTSSLYNEDERGIVMEEPFRPLFWHLDQIDAAARSSQNDTLRKSTKLLSEVLHEQFRDVITKRDAMVAKHEINFNVLWTLFKPGSICITDFTPNDVIAVKVTAIKFSRDPMGQIYYRISHDMIGWDGEHLGWQDSYTDIMGFKGRCKIKNLSIFPVEFHADHEELLDKLVERGKRYVSIVTKEPHMMSFNGEALDREVSPMWWQGEHKKTVSYPMLLVHTY